jgi:hypothetical protein
MSREEQRNRVEAANVGPGAVAGSGSVTAEAIAGRDVHYHTGDEETLHSSRLRAVIQELAALDEHNGGVHLGDYFDLKRRYPELSAEIDAAMQVQLAQQQRRFEARMTKRQDEFELWVKGRLDQVDAELRRIRRQMVLALFLSPALMLAVLFVFLLIVR